MSLKLSLPLRPSLSAGLVLAVAVGAAAATLWPGRSAAAAGPFQAFVGDWTGGGQVIGSNGARERIRCRANYGESQQGEALSQTIVCASPSYRIDIQSYVAASAGSVQGTWREETRNLSGQVTGRIEGGRFVGAVVGPGFSAGLSLSSNGRRQAVTIQPSAGGDIAGALFAGPLSASAPHAPRQWRGRSCRSTAGTLSACPGFPQITPRTGQCR